MFHLKLKFACNYTIVNLNEHFTHKNYDITPRIPSHVASGVPEDMDIKSGTRKGICICALCRCINFHTLGFNKV
jgi:hypothetical protein